MIFLSLSDLLLTPIFLAIIYGIAYGLRPKLTNKITKKYYIPGLTLKLVGGIALGLVYEFVYGGGDTARYFHESKVITRAFYDSPLIGIKLLLSNGEIDPATLRYASQMGWYTASTEFFIVKISGLFGIFCNSTYTVIALFFAFTSFLGMWAMFLTFLKIYPSLHKKFAIAIFYLPSVFFWGSGLMKDSITIGALGLVFFGFYRAFIEKKAIPNSLILTLIGAFVLYSVKLYILLAFLPIALFWVFLENNRRIKNTTLRTLLKPLFIVVGISVSVLGTLNLSEGNERYDIDKIGERTKINAEYLTSDFVQTGSAYNIGTFDGSLGSLFTVAPQAIVVALYRPFIWEVRNPAMLLSALEASFFIFLTLQFIFKVGFLKTLKLISSKPILTFCMIFSLAMAFAVGTNSGNFGSLVRYKIPLMPFYLSALFIMKGHLQQTRKPVTQ